MTAYQITSMMEGVVQRGTATVVREVGKPVAGKTGTLRDMFRDGPLDGVLVGKTGTLSGVKALAGYVPVEGDSPVRFVMLLNKDGIDNKTAYRPIWALLGNGLGRASAGPRIDDLAP